ncbi:hypothetical protein [Alkaliphilus peptidifermentans]|uniref:Uncharacterized protein n=1 Tax=Alkaliphilus peptidifermentans DSM 18978 TaxID=1120976 RepID=A0A1G5EEK7_9FIRM|nr:hypothetical protein [Alkaliphilus peptidifermentans]SCY25386.1 hypothetical protein SAMN03080606_01135 [Alkaliphilus peptidifermentans DSM 18978]
MKVRINTSLSGLNFSYKKGEEVDMEERKAKEWIKAGVAVEVKVQEATKKTANNASKSKSDG